MNDNFAQHSAQTPSPSTGSRQATHSVGPAANVEREPRGMLTRAAAAGGEARRVAGRRWNGMVMPRRPCEGG